MASNIVGTAYVKIHAITKGVSKEIEKAIKDAKISSAATQHIGESIGNSVAEGLTKSIEKSLSDIKINKGTVDRVAKDFADSISSGLETELNKSLKHLEVSQSSTQAAGKHLGRQIAESASEEITKGIEKGARKANIGGSKGGGGKGSSRKSGGMFNAITNPASNAFKEAQAAREGFNDLARSGMKMSSIIGVVITSIGDLVGGLGALVFGAAAAAPSFIAFAGVITDVGIGMGSMKIAMEGVDKAAGALWTSQTALNDSFREANQQYIDIKFQAEGAALAQQGAALALQNAKVALIRAQDLPQNSQAYQQAVLSYKQANLNYVQSIHKTQESTRAVRKGITATAAYQPFASLSTMQLQFVKFIVSMRPAFQSLRDQVSQGFIPYLQNGIKDLMSKTFPALKDGLVKASSAMGKAVSQIFKVFTNPRNIGYLKEIFKGAADNLPTLGHAFATLMQVALRMLAAAQPLIKTFVGWIDTFATNLNSKFSSKSALTEFFNNAGVVAAKLGGIIGNVASILGSFIKANAGPGSGGQILLDWIKDVTGKFADFLKSADGASSSFNWFKGAAENFKVMSQTIGKFVKPLFTLAGNPDVRAMWTRIGDAAPFFQQIVANVQKAAKPMGDFVYQLMRVISILTDQTQIKTYFDTLTKALKKVADFLSTPMVKAIMKFMGPITGVLLALGSIATVGGKVFKALEGHIGWPIGKFKQLKDAIMGVSEAEAAITGKKATEGLLSNAKNFLGGGKKVVSNKFIGPLQQGEVRASEAGFLDKTQSFNKKVNAPFEKGFKSLFGTRDINNAELKGPGKLLNPFRREGSALQRLTAPVSMPGVEPRMANLMRSNPKNGKSWTKLTDLNAKDEGAFKNSMTRMGLSVQGLKKKIGESTSSMGENFTHFFDTYEVGTAQGVKTSTFFSRAGGSMKKVWGNSMKAMGEGFGKFTQILKGNWILLVIGLLVMAFIKLYNSNKQFAAFINGTMKKVMGALSNALGSIMKALNPLIDMLFGKDGMLSKLLVGLMPILKIIINILVAVLVPAINIVVTVLDVIIGVVEEVINYFMTLGKVMVDVFTLNWGAIGNDISNGAKNAVSIAKNTAGSIGDLWSGKAGANGADGTNGTSAGTSWDTINKKNQDAAQMQIDAANKQYSAAVKQEKKDPTGKNKTLVGVTAAAAAIAKQRQIDAKSAFDQRIYYGAHKKGALSESINTATLSALQGYKGKNKKSVNAELLDYNAYNEELANIKSYTTKYQTLLARANKTGKKSDITAAGTQLDFLNGVTGAFNKNKGAYSKEFANLSFDPKTGKVTVNGAPTSTGAGNNAAAAIAAANGPTANNAPSSTGAKPATQVTRGGTMVLADGTNSRPYYTMIGNLTNTDWQAIKVNSDNSATALGGIFAKISATHGLIQKLVDSGSSLVEYAKESNIRDQAMLEYTLHKDKKAKIAGVNIGGQNMTASAFDVLSTKVTGISGVAGFNATGG